MKSRSSIIVGILMCLLILIGVAVYSIDLVSAQSTANATPPAQTSGGLYTPRYLPPIVQGAQGPGDLVFLIYKYLMGLVGIVAVGVIIYGGVLRTISADPGKIKVSNEYIKNAIKGIVLLFGAQVIFNTINPNIIDIARIQQALQPKERLTPQQFIQAAIGIPEDATSTPGGTNQSAVNLYGGQKLVCAAGTTNGRRNIYPNCGPAGVVDLATKIRPCNDCAKSGFDAGFNTANNACYGAERGGCFQNRALMDKLKRLQNATRGTNLSWLMTGSYPPGANHSSSCHWNGTCVDIALTGGAANTAKVDAFIRAAQAAGLSVVNEYGVGTVVRPQHFGTTTGVHLHVQ